MSIPPSIPCKKKSHYECPLEFVCSEGECVKYGREIACVYCCQEIHYKHMNNVITLKSLVQNLHGVNKSEFGVETALVEGIYTAKDEAQLRKNVDEIFDYFNGDQKYGQVVDKNHLKQKQKVKEFYKRKSQESDLVKTVKKCRKTQPTTQTEFISPILTFPEQQCEEQNINLITPFCIENKTDKIVTVFAEPALSRFPESVSVGVKIERIQSQWIGIGVSFGKNQYKHGSKSHILVTNNNWLLSPQSYKKSPIKLSPCTVLYIHWDTRLKLLEFQSEGRREIIEMDEEREGGEGGERGEGFLVCVLGGRGDRVSVLG